MQHSSVTVDYLKYFDREHYLFEEVHSRFHTEHSFGAFDFFSIVIWKANRAKSRIARKLLKDERPGKRNLESRCRALTRSLYHASDRKERLRLLIEDWEFALPMASAILAVCWPEDFPVYDYRIREQIAGFPASSPSNFENLWQYYEQYRTAVSKLGPRRLTLRDKDKYLYGKSNAMQLERDIRLSFNTLP